jgi:tripartite-type tricarboxylate transporter receptor subunit TctC
MVRSGRIRPLAVTGPTRQATLPDLPTFGEAGLPNFDVQACYGLVAPAGLPAELRGRLHAALVQVLRDPAVAARLVEAGAAPIGNSPEAFAAQIDAEIKRWAQVIRVAGIKPQ